MKQVHVWNDVVFLLSFTKIMILIHCLFIILNNSYCDGSLKSVPSTKCVHTPLSQWVL